MRQHVGLHLVKKSHAKGRHQAFDNHHRDMGGHHEKGDFQEILLREHQRRTGHYRSQENPHEAAGEGGRQRDPAIALHKRTEPPPAGP